MSKQIIEIEVPDGKKVVWKDGKVTFVDSDDWKTITSFEDAKDFLERHKLRLDLVTEYEHTPSGSYSETVAKYLIVIAALTNDEERHLTTGERWSPCIQFCRPNRIKNCWGSEVIGYIESEDKKYAVVGGSASAGAGEGLGAFYSAAGVSASSVPIGFRSVSSRDIAEHISKHFGKLLFEINYRGINCDWNWID